MENMLMLAMNNFIEFILKERNTSYISLNLMKWRY